MPMPKPTKVGDINIGANGGTDQEGRTPKTLEVKVVKASKTPELAGLHLRLVEAADAKKTLDAGD
jgi:hypothetical protein